ncbi:MAG: phosphate transport system regulatory protein PhoU [Phycisphaerae bacterium]|nr:phosphate transport system regulatory protein PhoU [Phycisphaerae bacterium]|tara:strand:+ start:5718 stop:6362 length:645 start_codon:yes stop_codon:yes gene_type:complete
MNTKIEKGISRLRKDILLMAGEVESQVYRSFQSLVEQNRDLAKEVRVDDTNINSMEMDLESECLEILALDHPVASDLRFVLATMRIVNSLERMADLAAGVAKRGSKISKSKDIVVMPSALLGMMNSTTAMIKNVIESLASDDTLLARRVRESDDEVDELRKEVLSWAQSSIADLTATSISIITIATKIERIADLATNIAEDVIFAVEGENVRHS